MSGEVISFTTVEYPDEASMLKAREVFQQEMCNYGQITALGHDQISF